MVIKLLILKKRETNKSTTVQIHRLLAYTFIPNDDPIHKIQIDHINYNRQDNRIENLRWVSCSSNLKNRTTFKGKKNYNFVDSLPIEAVEIRLFKGHNFEGLFYYNEHFYLFNGYNYREIIETETRGYKYFFVYYIEHKKVSFTMKQYLAEFC